MKTLDRLLQAARIRKAKRWIRPRGRVLDVGCFDASLFEALSDRLGRGVGLDPLLDQTIHGKRWELRRGSFPAPHDLEDEFDAITVLAVLEHVPDADLGDFALECARLLAPGGHLILTVPEPAVDRVIGILIALRLLDGMSPEQHHGFVPARTRAVFEAAGLRLIHHRRFQLGLNHLFVFDQPSEG